MMRAVRTTAFIVAAAMLVACGGGGGGSSSAPAPAGGAPIATASPSGGATTAAFALTIPSSATSSSRLRRPAFVSSAIESVAIFAAAGTAPLPPTASTLVNVGANAPGCTSVAAGVTCTITVPAVYGPMTFVVKTYSGTLGSGSLLSQASFSQTIVVGQQPIPLTLSGVVSAVNLSLRTTSIAANSGTAILDVNALDPSGATIVGSGTYGVPITVTATDPSVSLSSNTVTAPNQPITVTASKPTIVEFNATALGLSQNVFTPAVLTVGSSYSIVFVGEASKNAIVALPSIASFPVQPLYTIPNVPTMVGLAVEPGGNLVQATNAGGLIIYNAGSTVPSKTLLTPFTFIRGIAIDAAANVYITGYTISNGTEIAVYPNASLATPASGAQIGAPSTEIFGAATGLSEPYGLAVSTSGSIYELEDSPSTRVNVWTSGQNGNVAPASTLTVPGNVGGYGITANGTTIAVLSYLNTGTEGAVINIYANGATGPTQTWSPIGNADSLAYGPNGDLFTGATGAVGVLAAGSTGSGYSRSFAPIGGFGYFEPIAVGGSGTPVVASTTTVSGDFLAPSANKTWNYNVTQPYTSPYTISVYTDPQPDVSGNLALVGFMSTTAVPDAAAAGGTLVAAAGLSQVAGGYYAQSFGSVSNDTYGLVPGGPLLVPTSLTLGETYVPYPGVTATVTGVGPVPGMSACTNSPTTGATVAYAVGGGSIAISYVPGCGITDLLTDMGSDFRLTSITQNPQLGEQAIARRVLGATIVDTIRSVWKHAFRPWVKM